jgi:hypothetical protein
MRIRACNLCNVLAGLLHLRIFKNGVEMVVLIVWVLCSVLCGVVASQKKLNVALWAFLGLIFGLFAVVGVFVQKPRQ